MWSVIPAQVKSGSMYQLCLTPLNHKPSSEVVFEGDFLHPLSAAFTVRNKSQRTILFKIKTTCPHR